jgi:hypothetical protein
MISCSLAMTTAARTRLWSAISPISVWPRTRELVDSGRGGERNLLDEADKFAERQRKGGDQRHAGHSPSQSETLTAPRMRSQAPSPVAGRRSHGEQCTGHGSGGAKRGKQRRQRDRELDLPKRGETRSGDYLRSGMSSTGAMTPLPTILRPAGRLRQGFAQPDSD